MKKALTILLSTLVLSTAAWAAVPTKTLEQKLSKVNSSINWTNAAMTTRQVAMMFDNEKYDNMNSVLNGAFLVISWDLAKFNRPIADIQKDINLITYVRSLDDYTQKFSNDPELHQAAIDLLTHDKKSSEYAAAKGIFNEAIEAQKEVYHAKIEAAYGSYDSWSALWTRLNDTLKDGMKYPLEYDLDKLVNLNKQNYALYASFAAAYGDDIEFGIDALSDQLNDGIDALAPEVEKVIENYNYAVGIYDGAKLFCIAIDIAFDPGQLVSESKIGYMPLSALFY